MLLGRHTVDVQFLLIVVATGSCPSSWHIFGGSCYKYFENGMSRHSARSHCESLDAHLVTISSTEENSFIYNLADDNVCRNFWIGLSDSNAEGSWEWDNSEPVAFTDWRPGQPDNSLWNEDCVEYLCSNQQWNDAWCSLTTKFLMCETVSTGITTQTPSTLDSMTTGVEGSTITTPLTTAVDLTTLDINNQRLTSPIIQVFSEIGRTGCLPADLLQELTLGRILTSSKLRCSQFCMLHSGCTAMQIIYLLPNWFNCYALGYTGDSAQFQPYVLPCNVFLLQQI